MSTRLGPVATAAAASVCLGGTGPPAGAGATVDADGLRPARRLATGLAAGRPRDLPPIVLERP
jgi:hypothetical protein